MKQRRYFFYHARILNYNMNPDYRPWFNSSSKTHTLTKGTVIICKRGESKGEIDMTSTVA